MCEHARLAADDEVAASFQYEMRRCEMRVDELAGLIRRSLKRSKSVEMHGAGVVALDRWNGLAFRNNHRPRVFIAYALEDHAAAEGLFKDLTARGYAVWLDRRKLLPGQNWARRIEEAIAHSDFFIACYSETSVRKRGGFQAEVRFALLCASRVPLDEVFLIPVRLDECCVPMRIQRETQYIDLFRDWEWGVARIAHVIESQMLLI
jgi:hypothetical protein